MIRLYGEECARCGATEDLGIDHIRSLMIGGCRWVSNRQLLCRPCNQDKGHVVVDYRPPNPEMDALMADHDLYCVKHGEVGGSNKNRRDVLITRYGNRCIACEASGDHVMLTIDHVVPKSKGGRNTIDNLQLLCRPCNGAKGDKTIDYRKVRA